MFADQMLQTHPLGRGGGDTALVSCIQACFDCAQACVACADACLAEGAVSELTQCIRLNLDCADLCTVAGRIASRRTGADAAAAIVFDACRRLCALCAQECEGHAQMHEHCRICAQACRACEAACAAISSPH